MDCPSGLGLAGPKPASDAKDQQSHANSNDQTDTPTNRSSQPTARKLKPQRSNQPCRYFATKKGCRAGDQCRYQHADTAQIAVSAISSKIDAGLVSTPQSDPLQTTADTPSPPQRFQVSVVAQVPRAVTKPTSKAEVENPREFQLQQVAKRYSPFRADLNDATTLKFRLNPTDPDFPFELETGLHCFLTVPTDYPHDGRPTLRVQNPDMPRGYQINVENGFAALALQHRSKSLLALLNELDKNLETFLTTEKAATVKFVANKQKKVVELPPGPVKEKFQQTPFVPSVTRYSQDDLQKSKVRRDIDVRQLEARLGRTESFAKADDGVAFNIPLTIAKKDDLPPPLRLIRETALIVPEVYPLEPCTIVLRGVEGREAENVEVAFEKRAVEKSDQSLMAHINYLSQNIAKLAVDTAPRPDPSSSDVETEKPEEETHASTAKDTDDSNAYDPERPHVRIISRPPEWENCQGESTDETSESDGGPDSESEDDVDSTAGGASLPAAGLTSAEQGIQLSLPGLSLSGIELLHISKLAVMAKCDRCKEETDIKGIIPASSDTSTTHRTEACRKCGIHLSVSFRADLMHQTNSKAGYINAENCSIVDFLPTTFQPTCSSCSTTFPSPPGITAVRGDTKHEVCRTCHAKMTFTIPETKFLRVSTAPSSRGLALRSTAKPKKPTLPTSAGTPLPHNGACQHYSKSYRWFRFSCCARVFPCDKCHDSSAINPSQRDNPHANEHADRMVCGFCSREQRYHPEQCRHCGRSVIKKSVTTGFWEGGKGTRDRNLMRKKEGRKYKVSGREKKEVNRRRVEAKGRGGMWWPE